ncbi:MAG: hypothetical protein JWO54_205 [Candidatus Saccharibacteria bacterium]|nr:hypothetical protein [Candidatus Saccharibacteria bacterium]MDB5180447.1 hypothetical protein [Candidatus Saccharibacteria bacterium]
MLNFLLIIKKWAYFKSTQSFLAIPFMLAYKAIICNNLVTGLLRKVYIMLEKNGRRLVVELTADEAQEFMQLARTDDPNFLDGIAKSLILGAGDVVDPQSVLEDLELMYNMRSYGLSNRLPVMQEWADALSFTREQLSLGPVKEIIESWARFFEKDIKEIADARWTVFTDQVWWYQTNARVTSLLEILRENILEKLK